MATGKINGKISLPKQKDLFLIKKFQYTGSTAASTTVNRTRTNLSFEIPTGYKIFSIAGFTTGGANALINRIDFDEETNIMRYRNISGNAMSSTAIAAIYVTFIKKEYANGFWFDDEDGAPMNLAKAIITFEGVPVTYQSGSNTYPLKRIDVGFTNNVSKTYGPSVAQVTVYGRPNTSCWLSSTGTAHYGSPSSDEATLYLYFDHVDGYTNRMFTFPEANETIQLSAYRG